MDLALEHFSRTPVGTIRSVEQVSGLTLKPRGLWCGVAGDGGWEQWCRSNGILVERLVHRYAVTLSSAANILVLSDADALDAFNEQFGGDAGMMRYVDWQRVAADHDGIVIAPVIESCRLDPRFMPWYYGWDAASGCIWNADAIADLTPIG